MNLEAIEKVANAVLYEGYMLYPYRASSIKNRQRFNFGVLYPEGFDASSQRTEFLVCDDGAEIDLAIRYLRLDAEERAYEQSIRIPGLSLRALTTAPHAAVDDIGEVHVSATPAVEGCFRLTIEIRNRHVSPFENTREKILIDSMISVHTIATVRRGSFPSMLDPPPHLRQAAAQCRNEGAWPVLAGEVDSHNAILASPIILYDYPQIAPESPQNLFDATEIDEILTLRILTLTDEEKAEIRRGDERVRALLEQTESLPPEHLMKLHGALRGLPPAKTVCVFGVDLQKGDRVRLWPQKSADIMDIALQGKIATIEAIEEDIEGNIQFAVVIDDDPGRDLGELRQPGHRFFFGPEEVEPLALGVESAGRTNAAESADQTSVAPMSAAEGAAS
jgi:hypothetical protein